MKVVVLECPAEAPSEGYRVLRKFLAEPGRGRHDAVVVALGDFGEGDPGLPQGSRTPADFGLDQLDGSVTRRSSTPRWVKADWDLADTSHDLAITLRKGRLLAVHTTDGALQDRLLKWLDKQPRPPLRRIPAEVLEGALLQGEAKGLWLRGTHRRRTTVPDTKSTSGIRLQDTLDPFQDASFALGSARSDLENDPERTVLVGTVGVTPRDSLVWFKASPDFVAFTTAVVELLAMIEKALSDEPRKTVLSLLARQVHDLAEVRGAFEVTVDHPDHLSGPVNDLDGERAALIEQAITYVEGRDDSPDLVIDVGVDGATCARLNVRPKLSTDGFRLDIGYREAPTYAAPAQEILDALGNGDLLTVYYASGHTFTSGRIWTRRAGTVPFRNWEFHDFSGFDITREKPDSKKPQEIHDLIGADGDTSLFGWVVEHFRDGWLVCDDGTGEVADFLHISDDGVLSVIHVKGAHSAARTRGIAVGAYEVVTSQASKNLAYNDVDALCERLAVHALAAPACWRGGQRTTGRAEFLSMLRARTAKDAMRVVIVQPHVSRTLYERLRTASRKDAPSGDLLRLDLLDTLFGVARSAVMNAGGDLVVIGCY